MLLKERITQDLDALNESQLKTVADFIAFLKFRKRVDVRQEAVAEDEMAVLYAEFAEEDRALAEQGMADYQAILRDEDK